MNAFLLLIPLLIIRFGLMGLLDKTALKRAAFFPPLPGNEKPALLAYQIAQIFILAYLFILEIRVDGLMFGIGLTIYILGIVVCTLSVFGFAKPAKNGINQNGLYRITRNPMYAGYFFYYLGCVLLTRSIVLFVSLIVFQVASHWIILSEERWCINEYGEDYISYMKKVRRYL